MNDRTDQNFQKAEQLFFEYKFNEAIPLFRKALENSQNNKDKTSSYLAYCLTRLDKFEEAKEILTKITNDSCPEYFIAKAYLVSKEDKNYDQAIAIVNNALALKSDVPFGLYTKSILYYEKKDIEQAKKELQKAVAIDPNFSWAWFFLGIIEKDKGENTFAIENFDKAIGINSNIKRFWFHRAKAKSAGGDHIGAISDLDQAIKLDPKETLYWANRGMEFEEIEQFDNAISNYLKTIEIDPEYDWGWYRLGRAKYLFKENYKEGLEDLNKSLEITPEYFWSRFERGKLYLSNKNEEKALSDFSEAIKIDPDNDSVRAYRGDLLRKNGDNSGALEDYSKALSIDENYSYVLDKRASLYIETGQYELAISDKIKYYSKNTIPEYNYEDAQTQDVTNGSRKHLLNYLEPEFKKNDEKLIDYWECSMFWGEDRTQSLNQGKTTVGHHGYYGVGYICLTDKLLRIISVEELSRKYAKKMGSGVGRKLLSAAFGHLDMRRVMKKDQVWTLPFKDIQNVIQENSGFHLGTSIENWVVITFWQDYSEYLQAALDLARTGNLRKTIDMGKLRIKPKTSNESENPIEKIKQLAELKDQGIISEGEFEEKKKELMGRI